MKQTLTETLCARLEDLDQQRLLRRLRPVASSIGSRLIAGGRDLLNFSSNDYLGLAGDSRLSKAASDAALKFGSGSAASRLICGSLGIHQELEARLAACKGTESALLFSSGYAAAMGTIPALVGPGDCVVLDRLSHACLVDAAKLSGAKIRVFAHNDTEQLERRLQWASSLPNVNSPGKPATNPQILVVTESLFSMDGDFAPLAEISRLVAKYGAWLFVDEAHTTGVCGPFGKGTSEAGPAYDCDVIRMGTLGKALGSSGGFIAGTGVLTQFLVNQARSMLFSTAPTPLASAAALAGLAIASASEGDERRARLWGHVDRLARSFSARAELVGLNSPIVPVVIGEEGRAVELSEALLAQGFWVPAIRYPTVARGRARLRVSLSASHSDEDIDKLIEAFHRLGVL